MEEMEIISESENLISNKLSNLLKKEKEEEFISQED